MYATIARLRRFLPLWLLISLALLGGCVDGGQDGATTEQGEVVIGLTDAEGDFASYTVDVVSLTLTKANGAVVETLPVQTRIDFAQYTEMTEFVTAATIPAGLYTKAVMTVDFSNADIRVENAAGDPVPVPLDRIVDESGNPVTTLALDVHLEDRSRLLIVPGVPAHLTLDFDLASSNKVVFDDQGVPTQTVSPVLFADVDLEKPKPHRLRGLLDEVAPDRNQFSVIMRPFRHLLSVRDRHFGSLRVITADETLFEIDGQSYRGSEGLRALDALPAFSAVVVIGEMVPRPHRFKAREVYAGSSVPGGSLDVVRGNVIKRTLTSAGDVLTVKGTLMRADGSIRFNDEVTVLISSGTRVTRQLSMDTFTSDDISVGQRVMIYGQWLTQPNDLYMLDASNGRVRMLLTTLRGTTVAPTAPEAAYFMVDLQRIDRRRVALFDFTGTGIDAAHDADPRAYEIDTGVLDTSGFGAGEPLLAKGFVRPFGQAPADFEARSLIDVSAVPATLAVNWAPPAATAFSTVAATGITLDLTGAGRFHHLRQGGVLLDLATLGDAPQLLPPAADEGRFLIRQRGRVQLHSRFGDFAADLAARLDEGAVVSRLRARGDYDGAAVTLRARVIKVTLE